jgi:hypothetical protein
MSNTKYLSENDFVEYEMVKSIRSKKLTQMRKNFDDNGKEPSDRDIDLIMKLDAKIMEILNRDVE